MVILLLVNLVFYFVMLWFGVIHAKEGTNPTATMLVSTILFGTMITTTTVLIIKFCFGYWILSDDSIISKELFSKTRRIKFCEIMKVEKKIIPAFILGLYKSNAYIIYSSVNKITILINDKKEYSELDTLINGQDQN